MSACYSDSLFLDRWDDDFKDAVIFMPPGTDYRLLVAQCYQESRLDPYAVSPAGAQGLCQFMPATWAEVSTELSLGGPLDPESSILAAGYYMGKMAAIWTAPRPPMDRWMLSAASYNAGAGHLIKAQRLCGGANFYKDIAPCLVQVTGSNSRETLNYVKDIVTKWYPMFLFR